MLSFIKINSNGIDLLWYFKLKSLVENYERTKDQDMLDEERSRGIKSWRELVQELSTMWISTTLESGAKFHKISPPTPVPSYTVFFILSYFAFQLHDLTVL